MSFNRRTHDLCEYKNNVVQSVSTLSWTMDPNKYHHTAKCRVPFGIVGGNEVLPYRFDVVDVESELRNQTRPISQCPCRKYLPTQQMFIHGSQQMHTIPPDCAKFIDYKKRADKKGKHMRRSSCHKNKSKFSLRSLLKFW